MPKLITDTYSPEWLIVKEYCEGRIASLREYNDGDHEFPETNRIRGGIKAFKEILSLSEGDQRPIIGEDEVSDENYL